MCTCLRENCDESVSGIGNYGGCFSELHVNEETSLDRESNGGFSGLQNNGRRFTGKERYGDIFSSQGNSTGRFRGWENYDDNLTGPKYCAESLPGKDNYNGHFSDRETNGEGVSSLQVCGDSLFSDTKHYEQHLSSQESRGENSSELEKYRDNVCCWENNGECFTRQDRDWVSNCDRNNHGEDYCPQQSHEGSVAGWENYKNHFSEQRSCVQSTELGKCGECCFGQENIGESFGWQEQYQTSFAGCDSFFDNTRTPAVDSASQPENRTFKNGDEERAEKETESNVKKLEGVLISLNQNGWKERWIRNSAEKLQEVLISLSQEVRHEEETKRNAGELQEMLIRRNLDDGQLQDAVMNHSITTNLTEEETKEEFTKNDVGTLEEEGQNKSSAENLPDGTSGSFSALLFVSDSPNERKEVNIQSCVEKSQEVKISASPSETKEAQIRTDGNPEKELTDEPVKLSQSQKRRKRRKRLRARLFAKFLQQSLDQEELESSRGKMISDMKFVITAVGDGKNDDDDDGVSLYGMCRP